MDHLLRSHAPLSPEAFDVVDQEAKSRLTTQLAARKLVDFDGPGGWERSSVDVGRADPIASPADGLSARRRRVQPLVELRAEFTVARAELDDLARGAGDPALDDLDRAARRLGSAENVAVFHGYGAGEIRGITEASSHEPISLDVDFERYPNVVGHAVEQMRRAGIDGPYGLAIGPDGDNGIVETTEHGGYLLLDHLRRILEGPVVWAPGLEGAVVLSLRGGDFVLSCGQDLSIGYLSHDPEQVRLYLEESFTFRVLEPDAAVVLRRGAD
jgi:uncharacterized linocin/CFP29 family protein